MHVGAHLVCDAGESSHELLEGPTERSEARCEEMPRKARALYLQLYKPFKKLSMLGSCPSTARISGVSTTRFLSDTRSSATMAVTTV
jgi:hypothetical protein